LRDLLLSHRKDVDVKLAQAEQAIETLNQRLNLLHGKLVDLAQLMVPKPKPRAKAKTDE
jgi:hypothetical protein